MRPALPLLAALAALALLLPPGAPALVLPPQTGPPLPFEDGFEGPLGWLHFEEPTTPCHSGVAQQAGIMALSPEAARTGQQGLLMWPNAHLTASSNHLSAIKRLDLPPEDLALPMRYTVHGRIPLESWTTTQAGPEFSLQDTRSLVPPAAPGAPPPGPFLTSTAGFQYVANLFVDPDWYLWIAPVEALEDARLPGKWMPVHTQALQPDAWYRISLDVDFAAGRYLRLEVTGPGVDVLLDLDHPIPREAKGFVEEGFWISLDAENLWTCTSDHVARPVSAKLHYDDVRLARAPMP